MARTYSIIKGMDIYRQVPKDVDGFPLISKCTKVPKGLVSFVELKRKKRIPEDNAVHFFLHDQKFERVWNQYHRYTKVLSKFEFLLTPDFSAFMDMPPDLINYNVWRSRLLGSWWQMNGIDVIPTVTWAGVNSYDKCFSRIEPGGNVAIGPCPLRDKKASNRWHSGVYEMYERLQPPCIIIYGCDKPPIQHVNADIVTFQNPYIERMRRNRHGR